MNRKSQARTCGSIRVLPGKDNIPNQLKQATWAVTETVQKAQNNMSCSLNFLKGGSTRDYTGFVL